MPRLLPRLVKEILRTREKASTEGEKVAFFNEKPKLKNRVTPRLADSSQTFSLHGRNKSILLDEVNPILHRDQFLHKKLGLRKPFVRQDTDEKKDKPQTMSLAERGFSSNPYIRMLSSPLRQCILTGKYLPTDFMIRLAILQTSNDISAQPRAILLPDGLEHPRYRRRSSGRGCYIMCHKQAIHACIHGKKLKRIPTTVKSHSLLSEQLVSQLRNRVLQELDLLADRLRCTPQKSRETFVVRKLTRSEWNDIKSSGRLSHPGAVAILIVPPVQKRTLLCAQEPRDYQQSSLSPLCEIYPNILIPNSSFADSQPPLSPNIIPVYNGVALFPLPSLRHELHQKLQMVLTVERKARWRQKEASFSKPIMDKDKQKSSHAYVIFADHDTVQRSDSVPLTIALWRLRLWEGFGWNSSRGDYGGWCEN